MKRHPKPHELKSMASTSQAQGCMHANGAASGSLPGLTQPKARCKEG